MLRETALNTKRLELGKCVVARKRKISELYHVAATVAATVTGLSPHDHNSNFNHDRANFTEWEFADANDIALGRYFDIATLRRVPGGDFNHFGNSAIFPASQPPQVNSKGDVDNVNGKHGDRSGERAPNKLENKSSQTVLSGYARADSAQKRPKEPIGDTSIPPTKDGKFADRGEAAHTNTAAERTVQEPSSSRLSSTPGRHTGVIEDADTTKAPLANLSNGNVPSEQSLGPSAVGDESTGLRQDASLAHERHQSRQVGPAISRLPDTGTTAPKPNGESVAPLGVQSSTPDAQLQQEAAQFSAVQARDACDTVKDKAKQGEKATGISLPMDRPDSTKDSDLAASNEMQESTIASRRKATDQRLAGMASEISKDIMLSQRPPMRIDTAVGRPQPSTDSATPSTSFTPLRTAQVGMQSSPPERMTTRVSSGALRHKSVSEILGETPKTSNFQGERNLGPDVNRDEATYHSRRSSLVASPESAGFKSRFGDLKDRDKDRSKLSTVVFARQQAADRARNRESRPGHTARRDKSDENKDYLVPLFAAQAAAQTPTLGHLITNAHKTLSTANHYVEYHEGQDCRILKRIYHLQNSNRWSLRQFERSAEPPRPTCHWDELLAEGKWMRTDFREERKWKITAAKNLADWCAEWVATPIEVRLALQVKVRSSPPKALQVPDSHTTPNSTNIRGGSIGSEATPELIHSAEDELSDGGDDDIPLVDVSKAAAPASLFSLPPEDVLFTLEQTAVTDKLLSELPLYQPFPEPRGKKRTISEALDSAWQKPVIPVSKYTLGKLVVREDIPRRKRSRYDYAEEEEIEQDFSGRGIPLDQKKEPLPPEQDDVALFNPKNKHIIARLHAAHAFRPPSEFNMPSQSFFEARNPSQWTLAEDDELRRLVREYEYNWSLISACLSSQSQFSSGAERRTPWECFERWESFEGLPGDMDKHSYFRAWKSRRTNAKQHLEQQFMAMQQLTNNTQAQLRRRASEPVHVERRRNNKHLALLHAMSKVAKKKETALQKQQHVAQLAALRKAPEPSQPRLRMQTPQEFSAHKYKQECEFKEKQMLYRQQLDASRRAVLSQQRAAQQSNQQQAGIGVPQQGRVAMPGPMNGTSPRMASSLAQNATSANGRPLPPSQAMLNGVMQNGIQQNGQMSMRGGVAVPQAQMQAYMQGQQQQQQRPGSQATPDSARVIMEASRLQEQQRLMQQRQFQTQANGHTGVATAQNGNMNHQLQPNAAMMGNLQHSGKVNSVNGVAIGQQRSSGSPIGNAVHSQQLSSGMVPLLNQIQSHIKAMNPTATPEQIKQLATANLNQHLRTQNSQSGNNLPSNSNGPLVSQQQAMGYNGPLNPQMYAQFMRSQQASQQNRHGSSEANGPRPDSRGTGSQPKGGATPNGSSQSPRPPQAQMAGSS